MCPGTRDAVTPSLSPTDTSAADVSAPPSQEPVKVVICGAGPAGLLLAHFLLGRGQGKFRVVVYDKAEDPRETLKQDLNYRRYSIGISKRGENSLKLVPGLLEKVKGVTVTADTLVVKLPLFNNPLVVNFPQERTKDSGWVVDRVSLCARLAQALEELYPEQRAQGLLELCFGCPCTAVDLQGQQATFTPEAGGEPVTESYDLLVGSDGLRSAVRLGFQQQVRGFEIEQRRLTGVWTVAHFDCPPEYPKTSFHMFPVLPNSGGLGGLALPSPDGSLCFILGWNVNDNPKEWLQCSTPAECQRFLHARLPYFNIPEEAAWKLRSVPPQTSMRVKCWQYHDKAGHAVLIGDAAHATAPSIGQGCNSSLVDASVLGRLLLGEAVSGGDRAPAAAAYQSQTRKQWHKDPSPDLIRERLPTLLAYFSALQVKEGHALVEMSNAHGPMAAWAKLLWTILFIIQNVLFKLMPFLFWGSCMSAAGLETTPLSVLKKRYWWETNFFQWTNDVAFGRCYKAEEEEVLKKGL